MIDRVAEITQEALSLPIAERIEVARQLWRSLDDPDSEIGDDPILVEELRRRDAELIDGTVRPRTHEEVMERMRRAIGCK